MTSTIDTYLLRSGDAERDRLRLQARVWEPEAEIMLDHIGVRASWQCVDVGCGGMGILGPLSRRVAASGHVVGVDIDPIQIEAARAFIAEAELGNVEILQRDAYNTGLPRDSFDLVHARFVFAPAGVLAIQEPDASSWNCFPPNAAWDRLKSVILSAFVQSGGDFNAGRRTYSMLRHAGLEDVRIRAAVLALHSRHPYLRLPILFATSLRQRILERELLREADLDDTIAEYECV